MATEPQSGPVCSARQRAAPIAWKEFIPPAIAFILLVAACYGLIFPSHFVHRLSDFGGHTLHTSFMAVGALLIFWRAWKARERQLFWWPLGVAVGAFLLVEALKIATGLPRPDGAPTGFPSGHTTLEFATAWLLTRLHPRLAPLWYAIAVAVGWSRIEGDAHFPYQVFTGAVLGTILGWLISRAWASYAGKVK